MHQKMNPCPSMYENVSPGTAFVMHLASTCLLLSRIQPFRPSSSHKLCINGLRTPFIISPPSLVRHNPKSFILMSSVCFITPQFQIPSRIHYAKLLGMSSCDEGVFWLFYFVILRLWLRMTKRLGLLFPKSPDSVNLFKKLFSKPNIFRSNF